MRSSREGGRASAGEGPARPTLSGGGGGGLLLRGSVQRAVGGGASSQEGRINGLPIVGECVHCGLGIPVGLGPAPGRCVGGMGWSGGVGSKGEMV